ncbi:MAG: DNA translocase FtsK [Patescibacteria group bacterium]
MAQKNKKKIQKEIRLDSRTESMFGEKVKKTGATIASFVVAIFLTLAWLEKAGAVGDISYRSLSFLFGAGYTLAPIIALLVGISFLTPERPKILARNTITAIVLLISALGLIEISAGDGAGGAIGSIISLVIMFEERISFDGTIFGLRLFGKAPDAEITDDEVDEMIGTNPENETSEQEKPNVEQQRGERRQKTLSIAKNEFDEEDEIKLSPRRISNYTPPPTALLEKDSGKPGVGDIKANANIIKRTMSNFGIEVEMDEISIGPAVTRYALKPAEGVKLSKISGLQDNLALALAAHPLRIEAPIPGKSLVGIEIPNSTKITVGLGTLLSSRDFAESPHPLYIALGKGISGAAHFANLAKAPHLLIAGATGSGKSVTIHSIIISLLYRNSPENLRLIMIDPKRVELTLYNGIPHLLTPVITDPKKAIMALKWAAKEMERRYNILEKCAVRDIASYQKNIEKKEDDLPYIVIVIDELADIMSTYPRELEAAIVRLAQMSRAVGIHLILSTQRPSVEIITGLIKANIPSRVALQVPSQIDSRTIIDMPGAEKLLGAGDMLYMAGDMGKPVRIQSTFVSEEEVKKVVRYLTEHIDEMPPSEVAVILTGNGDSNGSSSSSGFSHDDSDDDNMYEEAKQVVIESGKASTSYLQRRLKVGYARAARLMDMLEENGVVGPGEGAKAREVYGQSRVPDAFNDDPNVSQDQNI